MRQQTILALIVGIAAFALMGCDNQIPKDEPLAIAFTSSQLGAVRGLEEVRVAPDLTASITNTSSRCKGEVPPWQYKRLVSTIRRMNVESRVKSLWMNDGEKTFTLSVTVANDPTRRFEFEGDQSSTYSPLLLIFQKVRHQIALNGNCNTATAISKRQEYD